MINALRYEPHSQRQRFEPRERQSHEGEQRHLHLHLHLTLGARRAHAHRFWQPTTARVTTIFAAFIGALSMALSFTFLSGRPYSFVGPHIELAFNFLIAGALLGLGAVLLAGLPLAIEAWRSSPRSRLLLLTPLLAIPTLHLVMLLPFLPVFRHVNGDVIFAFLLYAFPLLNTIAIVRAIRRAQPSDKWLRLLRFTRIPSLLVVGGMLLMLAGLLLWGGTVLYFLPAVFPQLLALLTLPSHSWLLELIGMLIALAVALFALFSDIHAPERTQARPKDASPADVDWPEEPRGYRG